MCDVQTVAEAQRERELAKLRADLAAAVAERDTKSHALAAERADYERAIAERDQLRAFKSAVEAAPTVAFMCRLTGEAFSNAMLMGAYERRRSLYSELIARPATDPTP